MIALQNLKYVFLLLAITTEYMSKLQFIQLKSISCISN